MLFNIYEKTRNFDFKTFNLGLTWKHSYLERDDYLKSKFKIKGIENLKFSISNELAKKIDLIESKKTNLENAQNLYYPTFGNFVFPHYKMSSCSSSSSSLTSDFLFFK